MAHNTQHTHAHAHAHKRLHIVPTMKCSLRRMSFHLIFFGEVEVSVIV